MISPSANAETLNDSADLAADAQDDDGSLDGGEGGLPGKLSPTTTAVSFSSNTGPIMTEKERRASQHEQAMMAASQILEKLDFLPDDSNRDDDDEDKTETERVDEEEENENFVDPATVKARAEAAAVLEALDFLPEEETERDEKEAQKEEQQQEQKAGEEVVEKKISSPKQQRLVREESINIGGGGNGTLLDESEPQHTNNVRTLSSLSELDNNKHKYLRIVKRKVSTSEKVAKDPTAGAKTAEEALFAWRRDMQVTLENFEDKRMPTDPFSPGGGGLDMSVSAFGVRKDLAWDHMSWLDDNNNNNNNNNNKRTASEGTTASSSKRQASEGIRPHREALHKQRIYIEGEEPPSREFDFCDWLERSLTPPEKHTVEKMGYCRKQREECILL